LKKSDEAFVLVSLYNKILENSQSQLSAVKLFEKSADKLYREGSISKRSVEFFKCFFDEKYLQKQIDEIAKNAIEKEKHKVPSILSKEAEELIDRILGDDELNWKDVMESPSGSSERNNESHADPCGGGFSGVRFGGC